MARSSVSGLVARSLLCVAIATVPVVAQQNPFEPAPAATSKFAGSFNGEGTQMTLTPDGRGGYTGAFVMNGTSYPLTATEANGAVTGTFTANGQSFPFTAAAQADGSIVITSGNGKRTLQRTAATPAPTPAPAPAPVPPPPPVNPAPPANGGATGGIGMRAEMKDGKLVVAALAPGGPAEKSKVPVGGVIRAVDGKPIEGMNEQQVGQLIRGQPGTLVTVSVETATEVLDFVLTRAELGQPQPPTPVANNPADVLKPGFRATWSTMMVPVAGATSPLNQNEQNQWVDAQTGQPVQVNLQPTAGNAAYQQLTVVAADPREVASELRTFVIVEPQQQTSVQMQTTSLVVQPGANVGDFYVPPANLARMADAPQQQGTPYTFKRVQFPMNGQNVDALSVRMRTPQMYQHNVYDMKSGLLIASGSSMLAPQQQQPQQMDGQQPQQPFPGQAQPGGQQVMVQVIRLVEQRQLAAPWASQAMPAWMRSGTRLEYAGTAQEGNAPQQARLTAIFAIGEARPTWTPAQQEIRVDGQPQAQASQRALSAHSFDPLYIDPQVLARLQPNQPLDDDRSTQTRVTFQGLQDNVATFVEQSPTTTNQYRYDARTGVLTNLETSIRTPMGATTIRVQLQNPPQ